MNDIIDIFLKIIKILIMGVSGYVFMKSFFSFFLGTSWPVIDFLVSGFIMIYVSERP